VADGAVAIEALGDAIDATVSTALGGAYPGLRLIKKQTIGTGVSSVTVTSAFSATYDNYKIIVSGGNASADGDIKLTLGATASGYFQALIYSAFSGPGVTSAVVNNGASWQYAGSHRTTTNSLNCELFNPFNTDETLVNGVYVGAKNGSVSGNASGFLDNSTSYTAFTLTASSGTLTGGTIYVYGYGAS
jgi:hypothetical protein